MGSIDIYQMGRWKSESNEKVELHRLKLGSPHFSVGEMSAKQTEGELNFRKFAKVHHHISQSLRITPAVAMHLPLHKGGFFIIFVKPEDFSAFSQTAAPYIIRLFIIYSTKGFYPGWG